MLLVILKVLIEALIRTIRDITYPATYSGMKVRDGAESVLLCSAKPLLLRSICLHVGWQVLSQGLCSQYV